MKLKRTQYMFIASALLLNACDSGTGPVVVEPDPVELTVTVNIQLGDTPAGQQPGYIITGQARATQGGINVGSAVDSVVVFEQGEGGNWARLARHGGVPATGSLPFAAVAGQPYSMLARLYARGFSGRDTVSAVGERENSGSGF